MRVGASSPCLPWLGTVGTPNAAEPSGRPRNHARHDAAGALWLLVRRESLMDLECRVDVELLVHALLFWLEKMFARLIGIMLGLVDSYALPPVRLVAKPSSRNMFFSESCACRTAGRSGSRPSCWGCDDWRVDVLAGIAAEHGGRPTWAQFLAGRSEGERLRDWLNNRKRVLEVLFMLRYVLSGRGRR